MINISEELKNRIIDNSDIVSIIGEYVDLKKSEILMLAFVHFIMKKHHPLQ